ncbi:MAG: glycosyltransferase family 2 protein [Clostridia bacterium]|nr:glycosyltransferase family 2 protein [Clostridia bacterium]MDD4386375.1 glycosyltransferase family 2 protein [Clostridia bacterium]
MKNKTISVIIPMYNEQEVVKICYNRVKKVLDSISGYDYEIICINDGSKDDTFNILQEISNEDKKLKIISFSRNFGHQPAVSSGLKLSCGDIIIVIDADMQDPPELIIDMLKLYEQGNSVVYAQRTVRKGESKLKTYTAKLFYMLINKISDINIPMDAGDFRLLGRDVVNVINSMPERNKYLRGLYSYAGFKQAPIEYERDKRYAGKTKYTLKKMIKLALDGIISLSTKPLKIVGFLGFTSVVISLCIIIYAILSYIIKADNILSGWTSMILIIVFFGGVQLISLWIISEYIARIYDETKRRPEYIIEKKINL